MQRLIILSDLWGKEKAEWTQLYTSVLDNTFDIQYYDCCELGNVNKADYTEASLHQQFVNGGVEKAVQSLLAKETGPTYVLAFSIGGTIAWKAALLGLNILSLFAVSATRLRYEKDSPPTNINLYYGDEDPYKPEQAWSNQFQLAFELISFHNHSLYKDPAFAKKLSNTIALCV
ncbi:hypothetical protein V6R21_30915 [Limibacter armeniacum]|uniref:hypothetical protein n=1 Tax=Limibacter armeniacum TaxID=466084 RepID=UPI002FE66724